MKRFASITALAALALAGCMGAGSETAPSGSAPGKDEVTFDGIRFDTTEGSFTAILYPANAPKTVERYLEYVDTGYFVGRSFDRVIPGFMMQLTDCAISFVTRDTRTLPLEVRRPLHFGAGTLGIARAEAPNSGGAEFFVMDFAAGHLYKQYTVFAQVVEGLDVVRRSVRVPSINFTTGGAPAVVADYCAIQPVEITATERVLVTLAAGQAARYPLRTAERVRVDNTIYNLEWPANLATASDTRLTLYITIYDAGVTPPGAQDVTISVAGGAPLATEADPTAAGIYHFRWTPPSAGSFDAVVSVSGQPAATLKIEVPG